ncbi:hypothetical protein SISSUDRAFT_1061146 [Sistotremastrum suecicum HHB10207 ss-3]|uniref:Secreted protein n=1 Tax=Sistotremastrum suecicum HHB10207 ss-3 TaxID=1314776 RepID=A0A166EC05_9AGAM|nr:hypothetical protein SISSUDRAFT_1061146 [Sistotremastrum suecicum HHB10207 ss-3]
MVAVKSFTTPLIVLFALYRMTVNTNSINDISLHSMESSPSKTIVRSEYHLDTPFGTLFSTKSYASVEYFPTASLIPTRQTPCGGPGEPSCD